MRDLPDCYWIRMLKTAMVTWMTRRQAHWFFALVTTPIPILTVAIREQAHLFFALVTTPIPIPILTPAEIVAITIVKVGQATLKLEEHGFFRIAMDRMTEY
ncbi:unnamed protein product [Heligmosomoides polygyrus]|uniref:Secreted protein n=1 Tax=Heligmosomoides polygyrus TaxID=6339 RepID=A0A183G8L6_HELPZ|nr:unnamed protein product [Heligmosomoides polygyrus]